MRPTRYSVPTAPPGSKTITDWGARSGVNLSDGQLTENTLVIQRAIDETLAGPSSNPFSGRGGDLWVPPGVWEINDLLRIDASADAQANFRLLGVGGRMTSYIKQRNASKGVLRVYNSQLNLRGVQIENLALASGTVGLELHNDSYNLFRNITFHGQSQYALYGSLNAGFTTRFVDCWFSDIVGNCVHLVSGRFWMSGCMFGEASGGIYVDTGRIDLTDCTLYDSASNLGFDTLGTGTPVIHVGNGGKLAIEGGYYWPRESNCSTFLYARQPDAILINGGEFQMPANVDDFIVVSEANVYNGPLNVRPGRVISLRPQGLSVYREASGTVAKAHNHAVIDTTIDYTTVTPTVDSAWSDAGNSNTATLRARAIP